ncbi:MAG: transcription elongation factor [Proteobacteria bacterium]|nr:transcription elongation factor [Pseudomonadota bacterium]
MQENDLILIDHDFIRLMAMPLSEELRAELERAIVVPRELITGKVVTMQSRVQYREETTGVCREVEIVFPEDADASLGRVSVLAPVGAALIGLTTGQCIDWIFPDGTVRQLTVLDVTYPARH